MKPSFDIFSTKDGILLLGDKELTSFPTPSVILSTKLLRKNKDALLSLFSPLLPTTIIHPLDAAQNKELLTSLRQQGANFHASSLEQLTHLKSTIGDIGNVLYSGHDNPAAIQLGARTFIVSTKDSMEALLTIAQESGILLTIYLHLKTEVMMENQRYPPIGGGFLLGQAQEYLRVLSQSERVPTVGIWSHLGHQNIDLDSWKFYLEAIKDLVLETKREGARLHVLNIGGGFPIEYEGSALPLKQIHFALTPDLLLIKKLYPEISLELEPGRYLSGQSSILLTKVKSIESIQDKKILQLDHDWGSSHYYPAFVATKADKIPMTHYSIRGLKGEYYFPELTEKDLICFFNVGAYSSLGSVPLILE